MEVSARYQNEAGINSRDNEMMSSDISPQAIKALFTEC
jgi:hypothetical protein